MKKLILFAVFNLFAISARAMTPYYATAETSAVSADMSTLYTYVTVQGFTDTGSSRHSTYPMGLRHN
jgi:hypothetical protein